MQDIYHDQSMLQAPPRVNGAIIGCSYSIARASHATPDAHADQRLHHWLSGTVSAHPGHPRALRPPSLGAVLFPHCLVLRVIIIGGVRQGGIGNFAHF